MISFLHFFARLPDRAYVEPGNKCLSIHNVSIGWFWLLTNVMIFHCFTSLILHLSEDNLKIVVLQMLFFTL